MCLSILKFASNKEHEITIVPAAMNVASKENERKKRYDIIVDKVIYGAMKLISWLFKISKKIANKPCYFVLSNNANKEYS